MKAVILARVSTEEQKEAGNSLPAQLVRLQDYSERKRLRVIKKVSFDESAFKAKREKLYINGRETKNKDRRVRDCFLAD